ncbi:Galactosylceramidase [Durusdinium trenchii]
MDFNLDSGDVAEVETAVESTLVPWRAPSELHETANWFGAFSHFVRSEAPGAASSLSSARRLEDRRLQARAWAVSFDVFVYEQQLDNVTATVTDLRTAAAEARFAEWLQRELNGLGIGAGFSLFRFRELVDPYEVSISLISSTTTFTTSSTTTVTTSSSTTSSSSTSSSTSTTLFPLLLESAELTQGYSTLLLTFNERAMLTSYARRLQAGEQVLPPAEVNCGEVFTAATLALLGLEPTCRWVADGRNLEVKLGTSPTLTFSDTVETIDGALTTNAFVVVRPVAPTPSLRAAVFSNDPPAQPQAALLVSPLSVQACSEISAAWLNAANAARALGFPPGSFVNTLRRWEGVTGELLPISQFL